MYDVAAFHGQGLAGRERGATVAEATSLANDVMCWGMGYGSQTPVFRRIKSLASKALHGLWQTARVVSGVEATREESAAALLARLQHRGYAPMPARDLYCPCGHPRAEHDGDDFQDQD